MCAAAEISPATFFTYFPAKEDRVFADQPDQVETVNELLAGRRPGESMREVRTRVSTSRPSGQRPSRWPFPTSSTTLRRTRSPAHGRGDRCRHGQPPPRRRRAAYAGGRHPRRHHRHGRDPLTREPC
ncbi:hypothetical protein [Nonomuraea sp. KM88]|uniref:hypothetical protein n=1 Tax=Nonomuraea sp. KM88 TaxID=3457427 RepID=UPI003FCCFCC8